MNKTIAFIGAGNMAEALIRGLLAGKTVAPRQIIAADIRPDRLEYLAGKFGIRTGEVTGADIIILAVKPQQMSDVFSSFILHPSSLPLFISIAAGITTSWIEKELGGQPRVVRVMPNTPALVGAGAAALCKGRYATDEDLATAEEILGAVGVAVRVQEKLMDAVTALSGSGPAYIYYMVEALIGAGVEAGLPEDVAGKLAIQTAFGAGKLLAESGETPEALRKKVTSPGGTTEAALKVLSDRKFAEILNEAVQAAAKRARELAGGRSV
jgi:pyrroline-5-carboxylate reductase